MEENEQNDDEMILVVIGDDDEDNNYKTSKGSDMDANTSVKIEAIDDFRNYSSDDDKIFASTADDKEFIEIKPDVEVLDEEYLSQDDIELFTQDDVNPEKCKTSRKKRIQYLIDEKDILSQKNKKTNVASPKNKKRTTNAPKRKPKQAQKSVKNVQKKNKVKEEDDFFEIEFLEDDVLSPKPVLDEDFIEIELPNTPPKKNKRKTNVSPKKLVVKKEEYIPKEEEEYIQEEIKEYFEDTEYKPYEEFENNSTEDYDQLKEEFLDEEGIKYDSIEEDYVPPKGRNRKSKTSRSTKKASKQTKAIERPYKSFILELKRNQPHFKQDTEALVEYLVEYMRKRRPPTPPPNYFYVNDDNKYCCSYCDMEKPTEAAAGRHYQAAHGARYLVCLACGSGFRSTVILYKHEKNCIAPDADIQLRARGLFLGRKGRSRPYLTDTKYIPREPPPDQPPKRVHIPHKDKIKYYCEKCPAYFTREDLLEDHMHKHTGYRAFQCPECPVAYVSRYQLNKHSKKHSNVEYICDHCGKSFKLKTTLSSHMYTHLSRPRFGCGRCGRRYAKRAAVRVHIMRDHMHLPPLYACPTCPKRYNRMSLVTLHMKRDHGMTMLSKRSIERNLPYMKVEDLKGAKVVFQQDDGLEVVDLTSQLNEQILP